MIEIRPVGTPREKRLFLTFPWQVYRGDPLWVPPLLPERARVIDPAQGMFFKDGQAECSLAWVDNRPVRSAWKSMPSSRPCSASPKTGRAWPLAHHLGAQVYKRYRFYRKNI